MTEQVVFQGQVSQLFEELEKGNQEDLRHLEVLEDYGEFGQNEEGEQIAYFQWDGGGRKLVQYKKDGSLFLVQTSEIHRADDADEERDWYQVESREQAEWINRNLNGHRLTLSYKSPKIWTQEGRVMWRQNQ